MDVASSSPAPQPRSLSLRRYLGSGPRTGFPLFFTVISAAMIWAWFVREYHYVQAESGVGYALGIVGVTLMTLLLTYPLRKRVRFMRGWMTLKSWFRAHMVLGVLGPVCILLHCNFQLGSTNSSVALTAMLLVAGSGLIGRYLYGKFHYGLYGKQIELTQIKSDLDDFHEQTCNQDLPDKQRVKIAELYSGCCSIIADQNARVSFTQLIKQRRWLRQRKKLILQMNAGAGAAQENYYIALAGLLDKLAGLRLFERLFGLWHVVHIPVFILMIVTAIVHIFVVHWF
jgi:hypothetical protein